MGPIEQREISKYRKHAPWGQQQLHRALHPLRSVEVEWVRRRTPQQPFLRGLPHCPVMELTTLGGEGKDVGHEERAALRLVHVVDVFGGVQPGHADRKSTRLNSVT